MILLDREEDEVWTKLRYVEVLSNHCQTTTSAALLFQRGADALATLQTCFH